MTDPARREKGGGKKQEPSEGRAKTCQRLSGAVGSQAKRNFHKAKKTLIYYLQEMITKEKVGKGKRRGAGTEAVRATQRQGGVINLSAKKGAVRK